jgi:outer membrane protein OmpA-like peptidoglycan-associated protein
MNQSSIAGFLIGTCMLVAQPQVSAQDVEQSTAILSRDVASQVSAYNYREGPESELDFTGTPLVPAGIGEIEVEYQKGRSEIDVEVKKLPDAKSIGPYTTYVLWAVTPDGRATNLGAIAVDGGKGKLKTSYSGPQFALIVTAEPHFAVTAPSTAVALINVGNAKVKGTESKVTTLAERADYSKLEKIAIDPKTAPASLVGARYSVAIAAATGADKYAASAYEAAQQKLAAAEAAQASKKSADRKTAPTLAREATQAGEDARRAGMAGKAAADEEAKRAAAAAAAAEQAEAAGQVRAAEVAKEELRNRLSQVLPTRVTERGLVSELGGVQFATGTATLTTPAQVSLARFAGVVSSYPGLKFSVEGHSDNTGSAEKNQELSLRRAIAVRDNLIAQGIPASTLDVDGFGASRPVADNATAEGRAHNRRVEIVVSGGPLAK